MSTVDAHPLPLYHCWGGGQEVPELGPEIHSFPHANPALGRVSYHRDTLPQWSRLWVVYLRRRPFYTPETWPEGETKLIREACPLTAGEGDVQRFGKKREARCHTENRRHPWNDGRERPGYHFCGACGYPAWIEFHGVADGSCACCGYHG